MTGMIVDSRSLNTAADQCLHVLLAREQALDHVLRGGGLHGGFFMMVSEAMAAADVALRCVLNLLLVACMPAQSKGIRSRRGVSRSAF